MIVSIATAVKREDGSCRDAARDCQPGSALPGTRGFPGLANYGSI